jgi:hypothetical protein
MKQHFCSAENSLIQYKKECNWCGEKEWVGLTDEDFYGQSKLQRLAMKYAEAKLKEKNT